MEIQKHKYSSDSFENIRGIYSILYQDFPKNKFNITYNYNTKVYTLELTDETTDKGYLDVPLDFNIEVIYGDSISYDTPILLRNPFTERCSIKTVSEICSVFTETIFGKEEGIVSNLEVWSNTGWNPIEKIIRHKTDKSMYKVTTPNGIVTVSEDHSLLTSEGIEIKPTDVTGDTRLLTSFPGDLVTIESNVSDYFLFGFLYHTGIYNFITNDTIVLYSTLEPEIHTALSLFFKNNIKITEMINNTGIYCVCIKKYQEYAQLFYSIFCNGISFVFHESVNRIKDFLDGYYSYNNGNAEITSMKEHAELYFLHKRVGTSLELGEFRVEFLGTTDEYIYDIQTRDGTFAAGIGELIVKNTDSIFLKINYNTTDYEICRKSTFDLASKCGDLLTKEVFNRKPIEMEFEKVFQPFILLSKKRYIGKKYEDLRDPMKLKGLITTGIAMTRRDYSEYTKECYQKVIDTLVNESNINKGVKVFKEYVSRLEKYDVPVDQLVLSSLLAKDYKTQPVHVVLAKKMKERQMEIQVGDRIPYVFIESDDKFIKKSQLGEDPAYFKTHNLKFNRVCYLENMSKPIIGFFKVVLEKSPDIIQDIEDYTNACIIRCGGKKIKF
jgi:hypothetical protein